MIEEVTVHGRPALAAYMTRNFEPVADQDAAELVKLSFTDDEGGIAFLVPTSATADYDPGQAREPAGSPTGGQWVGGGSESFVSPSVASHLSFTQAKEALGSRQQQELIAISREIDKTLGISSSTSSVIGAWADGAENSLMVEMHGADPAVERAALAMKGHLADQKQVLLFRHAEDGPHAMAQFKVSGSIDTIHAQLLQDGIAFHTLEPHVDGTTVHVFSDSPEGLEQVLKAAKKYGSEVSISQGTGEFLGTQKQDGSDREQRDDARRAYEEVIAESAKSRPGLAKTWSDYRNRWLPVTQKVAVETPEERVARVVASVPGAAEKIAEAQAKVAAGVESSQPLERGGHRRSDGHYSAPRQIVHAQILEKIFTPEAVAAATPAPGQQPVVHLLGGAGGSGKSWFTSAKGTIDKDKMLYLNSDDIKAALPDYKGWNAPLLHEESSDLGRLAENLAQTMKLNVIIDGTMGSRKGLENRITAYRQLGYRVEGHFMRVSPETAAQRALGRFVRGGETGRYVPPAMLLAHSAVDNFESQRARMDTSEIYDNEGKAPTFVSRS